MEKNLKQVLSKAVGDMNEFQSELERLEGIEQRILSRTAIIEDGIKLCEKARGLASVNGEAVNALDIRIAELEKEHNTLYVYLERTTMFGRS